MKLNFDSLKSKTKKNFRVITTDFSTKNDFFYNNAYTIIKSNPLFNGANYIDILETINTNYEQKENKNSNSSNRKKAKSSGDARRHLVSENSKLKLNSPNGKLTVENSQGNIIPKNRNVLTPTIQLIENKLVTEDRKLFKFKKIKNNNQISTSSISNLKSLHLKNQESDNFKTYSLDSKKENYCNEENIETNRNCYTQSDFSPHNRLMKRKLISNEVHNLKTDPNNNHIINHVNLNNNHIPPKSAKLFLKEISQLKEKYLLKFQKKYLSNKKNNFSNTNLKIPLDSKTLNFCEIQNVENKNFKQANTLFRKFIGENVNKYIKDKKVDENTEPDPIAIKLQNLDNLQDSLPDYSKVITKLKQAVANIEKRKIILNYESLGDIEKYSDLTAMNKSKLSWDFHRIKTDCLPKEFQRKIYRRDDILEHLKHLYQKNMNSEDKFSYSENFEKESLKPKFKTVGKVKILIVPEELKNKKEIYEDQKLIQIKETRDDLEGILNPQMTNLKIKRFYDDLAIPKNKSPVERRRDLSIENKIAADFTKFEKINLNIVNQIKRIKKKFKKKSLYVDPKSAFEGFK
jgi:hypothetical protein